VGDAPGFSLLHFGVAQAQEPSNVWRCAPPGLPELGVATYFPDLFTGVGFECRQLEHADFGDILLQNGKALLQALGWISKLP
jgi:hypothetical protein